MNKFLVFVICITLFFALVHTYDESEYAADNAQQFLQKRLFGIPFPREQRREAKEKYEERCERALGINKVTGLQRWCPKLEEWDAWRDATSGDKRLVLVSCLNDVKAVTCAQGNSCQNGATCVDTVALNTHVCICAPQWTGDLCDYPTGTIGNVCLNSPCQNGATCSVLSNGAFNCICAPQWTGALCDIPTGTITNVCSNNPCRNGGACSLLSNGGFTCICPASWTGFLCDQAISTLPIQNNACLNGGTCVNIGLNIYRCICLPRYTGVRCEFLQLG